MNECQSKNKTNGIDFSKDMTPFMFQLFKSYFKDLMYHLKENEEKVQS